MDIKYPLWGGGAVRSLDFILLRNQRAGSSSDSTDVGAGDELDAFAALPGIAFWAALQGFSIVRRENVGGGAA